MEHKIDVLVHMCYKKLARNGKNYGSPFIIINIKGINKYKSRIFNPKRVFYNYLFKISSVCPGV